jgi:4-hydroxybenzoate polyprenyltransferase
MISKSTLLHLRVPFSLFLMPIFLFAVGISVQPKAFNIVLSFVILHFFIYPASNGYNSYFDKDEKSIGGLKNPPAVSKQLYYTSLIFDLLGTGLAFLLSWQFALMVFIYGLVSKAYSHPTIRLKQYPWWSWGITGLFQGFFTFWMVYMAVNGLRFDAILEPVATLAAILSTITLWGSYPLTQIYQHEEDSKRGDISLSYYLGKKVTFHFSASIFALAAFCYSMFFSFYYNTRLLIYFLIFTAPIIIYFVVWYLRVVKDPAKADYHHAMTMNLISSLAFSAYFLLFYFIKG